MKIECKNGFFIFKELRIGQVSDFMKWSGLSLVKWENDYTFKGLETTPEYSISGTPFLNLVATKTYEGKPWELFEQNQFVFNFNTGLLVPFTSIIQSVRISVAVNKFISNGLILPGSITTDGKKIKSYSGYFSRDSLTFNYSEVESV